VSKRVRHPAPHPATPAVDGDLVEQNLQAGRAAFDRGEFFLAHERWEDAWRELVGPARLPVQGLIQIAAGLHHWQAGRRRPALALLRRGLSKLAAPTADRGRSSPDEPAEAESADGGHAWLAVIPGVATFSVATFCQEVAGFIAQLEQPGAGPTDPAPPKFDLG
jgi:hypothetical protein